jgi:hypothetical protein
MKVIKILCDSSEESETDIPLSAMPPLSLDEFMRQTGLSQATCWRYRKKGWLKTVVISGRHYVPRIAIAEFNERAAAGEFEGTIQNPSSEKSHE